MTTAVRKAKPSSKYSAEDKAAWKEEKLAEQKALLESALSELTSSTQWENWVKFGRRNLSKYSFQNALLIWSQLPTATVTKGRKTWEKEGVTVDATAKPIRIFAPCFVNAKDDNGNPIFVNGKPKKKVGFYRVVAVYDVSHTDAPLDDMPDFNHKLDGDDLAQFLAGLEQFARELGYGVNYIENVAGVNADGAVDERTWNINLNRNLSGNHLVHTLLHELMHVYGNVNYKDYDRADAEVLVESATVMTLGMLGFDVSATSVPYIAHWGSDLKVIEKNAKLVEELTKTMMEKMGA